MTHFSKQLLSVECLSFVIFGSVQYHITFTTPNLRERISLKLVKTKFLTKLLIQYTYFISTIVLDQKAPIWEFDIDIEHFTAKRIKS